jgi:hypothetical protein
LNAVTKPSLTFSVSKRSLDKAAASASVPAPLPRDRRNSIENEILPLEGDELVTECNRLWAEAGAKFLAIGRYLQREFLRTQRYGTFESTVIEKLHFGRIVAYQLRTVAAAVDGGRIAEDVLPRSYATAYKLICMPIDTFEVAKSRGLVRPDVSRPEIERFKREIAQRQAREEDPVRAKQAEREKIRSEVMRLMERVSAMNARIAEINEEIGPDSEDGPLFEGEVAS